MRVVVVTIVALSSVALLLGAKILDLATGGAPPPVVSPPVEASEPSWLKYRLGQPVVGLGDPELVREAYERWKRSTHERALLPLAPSTLLADHASAAGWVRLDHLRDRLRSELRGVPEEPLDLWLVDNAPESGVIAEPEDALLWAGSYTFEEGVARLEMPLEVGREFSIDLVVVTPSGTEPYSGGLFYGAPTLFQRLAALEEQLERKAERRSRNLLALGAVALQSGGVPTGFPDVFSDLVTQGEDLFFNETFEGNGRTCGTCHFAVNNFTIDADLIARLSPKDPLFVAEFLPPLVFGSLENRDPMTGEPRRFENPALMRAFGLIVENLDGFGNLTKRFVMRGVPHNIGMRVSVERPDGDPGFPAAPDERTGWSGDGAPFGTFACSLSSAETPVITVRGTTRDFALGAVIQHFPRTLNRDFCPPVTDFRLPTDKELDAIGMFLLALGRQAEIEIRDGVPGEIVFSDLDAELGKELFRTPLPTNEITCAACHTNAGANPALAGNANIDTNVEEFIQARLNDPAFHVVGEPRPPDGGFGRAPDGSFPPNPVPNDDGSFGNGRFNVNSVVEAADSAPFFHAHIAFTLEEAIDFYATPEFSPDPDGRIEFDATQRDQVAAFMRAINALDNIENLARPRADKAIAALQAVDPNDDEVVNFLLEVAIADTQDAIEVLEASDVNNSGGLPVNAVKQLQRAKNRFMQAQNTHPSDAVRIAKIQEGIQHLGNAVAIIRISP